MRKTNWLQLLIYIVGYIVIFAVMGLVNLAAAGFDLSVISTANYWYRTISTTLTYIFAYQLTMNLAISMLSWSNKLYLDTEQEIQEIGRKQVDGSFAEFITRFNFANKRKAWIEKKTEQYIRLTTNADYKTLEQTLLPADKQNSKTKAYLSKVERYKEQLSADWIAAKLPFTRVEYPVVSPSEVISGNNHTQSKHKLLDTNTQTYNIGGRAFMLVLSLIGNMAINAIYFQDQPFNTAILAAIAIQLLFLLLNIFGGYLNGYRAFHDKILNTALTRRGILIDYLSEKTKSKS